MNGPVQPIEVYAECGSLGKRAFRFIGSSLSMNMTDLPVPWRHELERYEWRRQTIGGFERLDISAGGFGKPSLFLKSEVSGPFSEIRGRPPGCAGSPQWGFLVHSWIEWRPMRAVIGC